MTPTFSPHLDHANGLQIEHIETIVFRLPMRGALAWGAHSSLAELQHVLVKVALSDGSIGYAEAPPRPSIYGETPQSIEWIIKTEMAPRLIGATLMDLDREETVKATPGQTRKQDDEPLARAALCALSARMHQIANNHTARGALDMAIHVALANSLDIPLATYVGAVQERVRVSYILGLGDRDTLLGEAERVVAQGVRVLKVKVGREWQQDLANISALIALLGPSVELYADANECLSSENALSVFGRMADLGLRYCEEPLPVEQLRARNKLRGAQCLPIIADDSTFTARALQRELDFDTFDILNIKTARTGFTESCVMQMMAQKAGKGIMVGSQASAGLGTMLAGLFSARAGVEHPCELSFQLKLQEDIISSPLPIHDGYLWRDDIAKAQIDLDLVREHRVERKILYPIVERK